MLIIALRLWPPLSAAFDLLNRKPKWLLVFVSVRFALFCVFCWFSYRFVLNFRFSFLAFFVCSLICGHLLARGRTLLARVRCLSLLFCPVTDDANVVAIANMASPLTLTLPLSFLSDLLNNSLIAYFLCFLLLLLFLMRRIFVFYDRAGHFLEQEENPQLAVALGTHTHTHGVYGIVADVGRRLKAHKISISIK